MKRSLGSSVPVEPNNFRDFKEGNRWWTGYEPTPEYKEWCKHAYDHIVPPAKTGNMANTDKSPIDVTVSVNLWSIEEIVDRKCELVDEFDKLVDLKIETQSRIHFLRDEIAQCNEVLSKMRTQYPPQPCPVSMSCRRG